ncbi:MAG: hypothetical protein V7K98_09460 [Nostoc sp.]|uniref:hypothetical protein n=1 Tax=Nostoc sp. TaxID=1180 RepID=UPI002FF8D20F
MMKSAELRVLLAVAGRLVRAEFKNRPQGAGHLPSAKVLSILVTRYSLLITQHSLLSPDSGKPIKKV